MTQTSFTLTAPTTSNITLASSATLVELGISVWTARKLDKTASNEVTYSNNAARGMANVNKKLLDCDELTALQKFAANSRVTHYSMTLPWSDSGLRMLPTTKLFDYTKAMTALEQEFYQMVDRFLSKYEWEINEVQVKLGDLFNPNEYPSLATVRSKFAFRMNFIPLPEAGDFRVDVGNEAEAMLKEQYAKFYEAQLTRAMNDIWTRAHEVLTRMSERLDYGSNEQKKIFRDTLVSNVVDLIDIMDSMNVTGDPNMQLQQRKLKLAMQGITPEALREDAQLRLETKRAVDAAIAALPSLDW